MVLQRDWDVHEGYSVHRRVTREMGLTESEYVMRYVFDPLEPWCSVVRNRFPYKGWEDRHWLVWVHPRYKDMWPLSRVVITWGSPPPVKVWENEEARKSLPDIKHFHVYSS